MHPDCQTVIPLAPEPIVRQDGQAKNDCGRNASKRFLEAFRREHPHVQVIVLEDGLASNGPHLDLLERLNLRYLIGAREHDHAMLFQHLEGTSSDWFADPSEEGRAVNRRLRVVEDVPLSASRSDRRVTVLQCRERTPKRVRKPERQWTWITDLPVTRAEAPATARMARSRWKIENETFNTLKNQGYGLEHNYGHGHQYLANTLATLMMLAFLMDQIQQLCCPRFQAAQRRQGSYASLWEKMRGAIWLLILHSWEQLYEALAGAEPDRSSGRPTRSWFPPAIVQRVLRLLIAGIPPRSVDMRTGHALVRTKHRGPAQPKRSWRALNKGPKRSQRMENIQGQPLKTCRHCFFTGSGNCCYVYNVSTTENHPTIFIRSR